MFGSAPYRGNPLAVVLDGAGLSTGEMQRFAHWMNLSETTFVLPPTSEGADYQVRIFTPSLSCPLPGTPRWGPATRGWRPAGRHISPALSCSSAAWGW